MQRKSVFESLKSAGGQSQVHAPMLILPPLRKDCKGFVALEMLSPFLLSDQLHEGGVWVFFLPPGVCLRIFLSHDCDEWIIWKTRESRHFILGLLHPHPPVPLFSHYSMFSSSFKLPSDSKLILSMH